ncbi:hypothetical protein EFK50_01700 [Nocardioides marmoriginsengisoli]|uniref:Uncharacterized protein n=2 Tax=Nocardioides marmoriginsengisoli TaxID=661483 RepID=A0A3N0CSA8_9ACTN|nr:hypothetical protein EFK50_01700 [Nocardioides marmoriginsengisoli]
MSPKPRKPPIDKAAIRERLERARAEHLLVWICRWIPNSDSIRGFVVGHGKKWVLVATHIGGAQPDGWTLLRIRDIQAVQLHVASEHLEEKALKLKGLWPPASPEAEISLGDTASAITDAAAAAGPLLAVFTEFREPDACWIGSVISTDLDVLTIREISATAEWLQKPRTFDLDDITRIDVGDDYAATLHLVSSA